MRATWLADVLRAAGLSVVETDGWRTRGHELDAAEGVIAHHTASPPTSTLATNLHVVTNGNGIAPGPIANLLLWRDGTYYVIAAGKANHAGAGGPWGWLPESPPGKLSVVNARTIGIEAVNSGTGEQWAPVMLDAYEIGTAAILAHLGLDVSRALTHNEWAPTRKIDPAGPTGGRIATLPYRSTWSGEAWRMRVLSRMVVAPVPDPPVSEEDDMKYLNVTAPGRGGALVAIDGAGIWMRGYVSPADRDVVCKALGAVPVNISDAQFDDWAQAAS